jgi:CRISPR-associated protein Cas1
MGLNDKHEPLIRVMALHALTYCERLFYLEEVEEIRVADAAVFAGRTLHEELKKAEEESGEWTSREIASDSLGLVGKVDCLRRADGSFVPYEHKRGRPRRDGKMATAWPADALQVTAYAMLLEDETGTEVKEGRIRYHAENVTVRIPINDEARQTVFDAVARAVQVRQSSERPPVTGNDRFCIRCSLAPVCLPEEERLAADTQWEPLRLFPADRELKALHVVEPGSRIGRAGNTLKVESADKKLVAFPINQVGSLIIHGFAQITTQALHFCAGNGVPVHFISGGGRYVAGLTAGAGAVQRRLRQYQALSDPETCLRLARQVAMAKVEGALRYVLRATRGEDRIASGASAAIEVLRSSLKKMAHAASPDELRGHEGLAGRVYFGALAALLREAVPEDLRFSKRSRRPPKDRFNALLGFGYALLYQAVLQAILAVGLEPALGFFHTPRSSAYPLALDLMELFRVSLWDMVIIGSVNRLQWDTKGDFTVTPGRVWLSASGRKQAIELFEKRLTETWNHPVVGYSLSYARLIELEVRLLEKEWTGPPGLFAKMRLR